MPICAVPMCASTHRSAGKSVTLYRFPKDSNYARIWVRCCLKKDTFNTKSAYICSLHFAAEAFQRDINHDLLGFSSKKNLRKDAVPTLQLPSLGMLRKNTMEILRTEDLTSYYNSEKGGYPEDGVKLLDLMPELSPKSFLTRKISSDFFHSSRKIKRRSKSLTMYMNSSESTAVQMSDSSENRDTDTECISESTSNSELKSNEERKTTI